MDTSIFTDPAQIGPGIWFTMHIAAVRATSDILKEAFVVYINALCDNFKCKKCQPHFRKFIDTHAFKDYWNIKDSSGRDIGFFQWTWELHNQVNKFLKKYQPSLHEAYAFYSDSEAGVCFDCGSKADKKIATTPVAPGQVPLILSLYKEAGSIEPKPFRTFSMLGRK